MDDCATQTMRFETEGSLALEAAFDGGRLTSDGGLLWLARVDEELGLCEAISKCVPQWRTRKARHSLASLVRQRVFQIACGYDDQDDSDTLREDPLLKLCCGSLPESGLDPASQPTISRMENAATMRSCHRMNSRSPLRDLPQRAREGRRSQEGATRLRCDRRSHPRRAGRLLLPWLLWAAHLPSACGLRRRERASHNGALESGKHPRFQLLGGYVEAHGWTPEAKMARGAHRDEGGRGLRRTGHLRLLRG